MAVGVSRVRRGGRVVLAVAAALAVEGWLLLTQLHGFARGIGPVLILAAVGVASLAGRVGHRRRSATPPAATTPAATTPAGPAASSGTAAPVIPAVVAAPDGPVALRSSPRRNGPARRAVPALLGAGVLLAVAGQSLGGARGPWHDQPYLIDTLAGLTAVAFGAAVVVAVVALTAGEHGHRRSLHEARAAAGSTVATMLTAARGLLASPPTGDDRRDRGLAAVGDLRALAAEIETAEHALGGPDAGERLVAVRERWSAVVAEPRAAAWRDLEHAWALMEGDIRTRLVAAGDWLPPETAARVRGLVVEPERRGRALADGLGPTTPSATAAAVLADSRRYVDRLVVLAVQLLDLAELYEPPAPTPAGRTAPSVALGALSAIPVGPRPA